MVKIRVISIVKKDDNFYKELIEEFIKMSSKFAKIENINLFSKELSSIKNENEIKNFYSNMLNPYLISNSNLFNIALDVDGRTIDSFEFAKIFSENSIINFFIGGAYGFEREFLTKCEKVISLSKLTLSHKIAKIVLYEQIFRGLSIINNHPYHK